jgi:hypothetical protein
MLFNNLPCYRGFMIPDLRISVKAHRQGKKPQGAALSIALWQPQVLGQDEWKPLAQVRQTRVRYYKRFQTSFCRRN